MPLAGAKHYSTSNSVMYSNYVTKQYLISIQECNIHMTVCMHTPNTVSALGPLFSRKEKQMARLLVGM